MPAHRRKSERLHEVGDNPATARPPRPPDLRRGRRLVSRDREAAVSAAAPGSSHVHDSARRSFLKSHAVAVEVSHQPPRDWFPRWATALGGLIAMAVVIGSLAGLNLWSGQQQAAFRSVITLRSAVAVEQESLFDPSGQPTARQAAAAVALAEVEAAGIPSVDRASIVHLSAVYQAAVKRELTILRGGNPPAAVALDATVGDPAFRALDLKLGHVIDATAYASERGATIVLVMSIVVMVGAGAAVALFASFARRRQIRLFSAEANAGRLADVARFTAESEEGFRSLFDQIRSRCLSPSMGRALAVKTPGGSCRSTRAHWSCTATAAMNSFRFSPWTCASKGLK